MRVKAQDVFQYVRFTLPNSYAVRYREIVRDGSAACLNAKNFFECKDAGWAPVNVQIELGFREDLVYPLRPI